MQSNAIIAKNLSRWFGSKHAVNRINLVVPKACVYGFLGPNGSGKSTTIRMLCGLLTPSEGEIEVLGYRIPENAEALKQKIGYMTQRFSLFEDLSVRENMEFIAAIQNFPKLRKKARIVELMREFNLLEYDYQLAGTLSGGQKQRLSLACAVLHYPELLLLDEPTSAVDPESRRDFWEKLFDLADKGTTILVSTHYMDEAERCNRIAILNEGCLVADGAPKSLAEKLINRTFMVATEMPRKVQACLMANSNVISVAQIGSQLRILVKPGINALPLMQKALFDMNLPAVIVPIAPNLEDVFVSATKVPRYS